jgi:hypothetical protein
MRIGLRRIEAMQARKLSAEGKTIEELARTFQVSEDCIRGHVAPPAAPAPAPARPEPSVEETMRSGILGRKR